MHPRVHTLLAAITAVFSLSGLGSAQTGEAPNKKALDMLDQALEKASTPSEHKAPNATPTKASPVPKAVPDTSKMADAHLARGDAFMDAANFDQAIAEFTKAIEMNPNALRGFIGRGYALGLKGNHVKALAEFSRAIEINPNNAYCYYSRGLAWKATGDLDRAIADYTKAIDIKPDAPTAYVQRALAWKDKGDTAKAKADAAKARQLDPSAQVPVF